MMSGAWARASVDARRPSIRHSAVRKLGPGSAPQHVILRRARIRGSASLSLQPLQGAFGLDEHVLGTGGRPAEYLGLPVARLLAGDLHVVGRDILVDVAAVEPEHIGLDGYRVAH